MFSRTRQKGLENELSNKFYANVFKIVFENGLKLADIV